MARAPAPVTPEKRIETLETLLAKEREKSKLLGAERSQLARRIKAAEKSIERLEKAAAKAAKADAERQAALVDAQQRLALTQPSFAALVAKADDLAQELATAQKERKAALTDAARRLAEAETDSQSRIAAAEARAKKADADLADLRQQIEVLQAIDDTVALIAENRRIAAQLESIESDFETFREAALKAEAAIKQAREETDKAVRAELESRFAADKARLEKQVQTLTSQVQQQGKTPLISPDSAASLVDKLVERLRTGTGGLRVKDGEIKLKVAFGKVGQHTGFVVPTAESDPELKESLHEVVLRFDQVKS